jgi:NAD-dependent dihydropyrimidine dehydrogenase PreA subunit
MKKGKEKDATKVFKELEERVKRDKSPIDPVYKELAAKIGMGDSEIMQRIFARLANMEQARILQALPDPDLGPTQGRTLEVSEKFAQKLNMDKKTVDKHIRELFEKGVVFPTKKGPSLARTILQLHDGALGNPKYDKVMGKEVFDLWGAFEGPMRKPTPQDLHGSSEFRVMPRWKSIEGIPGVLPYENAREILKAQDTIVLLHCGCKRSHQDRWCDTPVESCITVGRTAQYNLDRGAGRKITYEQALEILDRFDEHGAVNTTVNQKDVGQLICNCHYCCCLAIRTAAKSRFTVALDPEKCRLCNTCIEACQFDAIKTKFYPEYGEERTVTDEEACRGCGVCVVKCPNQARTMKLVRPPEHIPESLSIY